MFTEEQLQDVAREFLHERVWDDGRGLGMIMGFKLAQKEIARKAVLKGISVEMINDITDINFKSIIREFESIKELWQEVGRREGYSEGIDKGLVMGMDAGEKGARQKIMKLLNQGLSIEETKKLLNKYYRG